MQSHARIVIVGGGIMGAGLLYHLAEGGWSDSLLIEKGELTSGPAMGIKNFWQCCGSSIGITQGAGSGKYLAQWMIHAEINMASVDPRRFCGMNNEDWIRTKSFQDYTHMYKLHLPGEEREAGRGLRKSAIFEKLLSKVAVYTEAASWERPKWFSLDGCIHGEATISRLADDHFYILSGATAQHQDLDHLRDPILPGEDVQVADITDDWGVLVVAGLRARDALAKITAVDLRNDNFRWLTGQTIQIAGANVRALRVNYVGELGWELHVQMADMAALYDAAWAAGAEFAIADVGTYAVNSLRLEKAYKGWGAELTNEITMIEADMERFVKYDKDDFIGKAATPQRKQDGIALSLVYCQLDAREHDAHGGEAVLAKDKVIGITTSGGWGHYTDKSLAFAYVPPDYAEPGSEFQIEKLGDGVSATVLKAPAYDPDNKRPRA